eukprot:1324782-Prymnesium_polylepis.2
MSAADLSFSCLATFGVRVRIGDLPASSSVNVAAFRRTSARARPSSIAVLSVASVSARFRAPSPRGAELSSVATRPPFVCHARECAAT